MGSRDGVVSELPGETVAGLVIDVATNCEVFDESVQQATVI